LSIAWHARRARIATGRARLAKGGEATVTTRLTGAGKLLLGRANTLTVVALAIFCSHATTGGDEAETDSH
jgi:hypothetical protein